MALGTITALGTFGKANGGQSVLDSSLLERLKEADEKSQLSRVNSRLEDNKTKQTDLMSITTLLRTFKSSVSSLTDSSSYQSKKVESTGSKNASISVDDGVSVNSMTIKVNQLAQKDSYQGKTFEMSNSPLNDTVQDTSFKLTIGKDSFEIDADSSTSLDAIASQINEKTGGKINAKVLNVGGDEPYSLIIQSAQTGAENAIKFSYVADANGSTDESKKLLNSLGFYFANNGTNSTDPLTLETHPGELATHAFGLTRDPSVTRIDPNQVQYKDASGNVVFTGSEEEFEKEFLSGKVGKTLTTAQDAKFSYNGIDITRSTNKITDLQLGVTINLSKVDEGNNYTNFDIVEDTEAVVENIQAMVSAYNTLKNNLDVATDYNSETGASGTFQGVSEIIGIRRDLNKIINGVDLDGKSLQDFGISLNDNGLLVVDSVTLKDKLKNNFDEFKAFFSTATTFDDVTATSTGISTSGQIKGTLTLNGKEINIELNGADEKARTKELLKQITNAGVTDIAASINKNGKLVLSSVAGGDLKIDGDSGFLRDLGLSKTDLSGKETTKDGFFKNLKDAIERLIGKDGTLTNYESSLKTENKQLSDNREKTQNQINDKYTRMQEQWSRYEVIINNLSNQLSTVTTMIQAATKSNN